MKKLQAILTYFFGIILIFGAVNHIIQPEFYAPMIPRFIPKSIANIFATVTEGFIGIMLFIPKYQKLGALGFTLLMLIFLPIHIWDYTKEIPMVGSKFNAIIRLVIQLFFIMIGWWIYKTDAKNK